MIPDTEASGDGLRVSDAEGDQARHGKGSDAVCRRTHAHQQGVSLDGLQKTDNLGGRLRLYVEAIFHNA